MNRPVLVTFVQRQPDDCRDIETWGSVNVHELLHPGKTEQAAGRAGDLPRLRLGEPLWVDPERVVLKAPLPEGEIA